MNELDELLEYYSNLLIIQYNAKSKASDKIQAIINVLLGSLIYISVRDAYDLDTAVGIQLDVLGKYIGGNRGYNKYDFPNGVFSFALDEEIELDVFDYRKRGFATSSSVVDGEGSILYLNQLNILFLDDDNFRILLRLKILYNNTKASRGIIDDNLFSLFGNSVKILLDGNITVFYSIDKEFEDVFTSADQQGFIPRAAGVKLIYDIVE